MAGRKDYYKILGVDRDADADAIKRAYRKLARKFHPDVNPNDTAAEERFKEISEAYHVLGDRDRRQKYDNVGPEQFAQEVDMSDFAEQFGSFFGGGFRTAGGGRAAGGADFGMFEEILGGLGGFGQRTQAPPRPPRGRDVQVPLQLSFIDAVRGVERTVGYRHAGRSNRTRVRVPAGVKDGATIKVRGKGEPSPQGGPAGDLLLKVSVSKHPRLRRRGNDLIAELPVTVYDAILGAKVQVPTLDGTATINLPRGTRSGQTFRLQGRGVPAAGGKAGDLLAKVRVQTPREVSDEVAELMRRFRDAHPYEPE